MIKLDARQLRTSVPKKGEVGKIKRNPIYIVLDNVLDTYNVGAIFRLADAVAAEKIFLCGQTETPPNSRIKKASINTWQWVPWSYAKSAVEAIKELRTNNKKLRTVAIEQSKESIRYDRFDYPMPICLVVGNETSGISKEVLKLCDAIVELPVFGVNKSLNVMVTLGIVLYELVEKNNLLP